MADPGDSRGQQVASSVGPSDSTAVDEKEVRRCRVTIAPGKIKPSPNSALAPATLVLSETKLIATDANGTAQEVLLEDLIGVQILPMAPPQRPNACCMEVHHYPLTTTRADSSRRQASRKFALLEVQFDAADAFKDNLSVASDWKKAVRMQCNRAVREVFEYADGRTCRVLGACSAEMGG